MQLFPKLHSNSCDYLYKHPFKVIWPSLTHFYMVLPLLKLMLIEKVRVMGGIALTLGHLVGAWTVEAIHEK